MCYYIKYLDKFTYIFYIYEKLNLSVNIIDSFINLYP